MENKHYTIYDSDNNIIVSGLTKTTAYMAVQWSDQWVKAIDPHTGTRLTDSDEFGKGK